MKIATTERKRQDLAQREELLLNAACALLEKDGFSNLTLEKLAAQTNFSKGTIYNHFSSKEDLLTAIGVHGMRLQLGMYLKVSRFSNMSRERMMGLHYAYHVYAMHNPTLFLCVLSALSPWVIEKTSVNRMHDRRDIELRITNVVDDVVMAALKAGDISDSQGFQLTQISFANWAMSFGTTALLQSAQQATSIRRLDVSAAFRSNVTLLLDGIGWHPKSRDHDYETTWAKLAAFFKDPGRGGD
jgi:AcrR family transcriptional regulator